MRHRDLVACRVDTCHLCARSGKNPRDLTVTGANIENAFDPSEFTGNERNDLVLVFRIGAVGEPFDPPRRMLLPQFTGQVLIHIDTLRSSLCSTRCGPTCGIQPTRFLTSLNG